MIARSYILTYSLAERSQEKSRSMPACCSRRQLVWSRKQANCPRQRLEQRRRGVFRENEAGRLRADPDGGCRTTVSASPPTAWTTGSVPYRMLYIWFRPQGSNRDGIRNKSEPASMRCASDSSNPMRAPIRSGYAFASVVHMRLITGLASTEHDERGVQLRKVCGERSDQVEALLIDHPRHHADERTRQRGGVAGQTVARQDRRLRRALPRHIGRIEGSRQKRIVRRIPVVGIDPVQDADQVCRGVRAGCRRSRSPSSGV